ncbi:MAG: hypothetical protein RMJ56_18250 [Gemmataceae bacterium]|nr:hypothetical protein [Gemmata sp.]MDW8199539.1 hypothetical protein [Gemmataceae bacterium]
MVRFCCGIWTLALLAAHSGAADDAAVALQRYQYRVGDRVRVVDEEHTLLRFVIIQNNQRQEKQEKRDKITIFVSETLAVKAGEKRPTKIQRLYERAEETKNGGTEKLPLHGKTVIIEKKNDQYIFTTPDGQVLDGPARDELDKEFNQKTPDDELDHFIPQRPLKPGETWVMDAEKLVKSFTRDAQQFTIDAKTAKGEGKFVESYTFGGYTYGIYDMFIQFPLTQFAGPNPIDLKTGSKMEMRILGDGNVDGREPNGILTMRITLRAFFDGPQGAVASIKGDGVMLRSTERLPSRKRD